VLWFPWARTGPAERSSQDLQRQIETIAGTPPTDLLARIVALEAIVGSGVGFELGKVTTPQLVTPGWIGTTPSGAGSIAPPAGLVHYIPIRVFTSQTFDMLSCYVDLLDAGDTLMMALYASSAGLPTTRLEVSGAISTGTTGEKTYTFGAPRVLAAGLYFLGFRQTALAGIRSHFPAGGGFCSMGGVSGISAAGGGSPGSPVLTVTATLDDPAAAPTGVASAIRGMMVQLRRTA